MKILVTGSSGFVGTHLENLLKDKHEIIPFDLKVGRDIRNSEALDKFMLGVDAVIHLAALVVGPESWERPNEYFETNGVGTLNVVLSAIKNKVKRIIVASSAAIYGEPLNPYGASKRWAEEVSETYRKQIETFVVRPFNIYGQGQNPAYGYAIHSFANGIKENGKISIFGDGNQTRDFISVKDVTQTMELLLTCKVIPDKPIDLGTGKEISINDLAKLEGKILKKSFDVLYNEKRKEPYKSVADISGLESLGLNPELFTKLEDGLRELIV